MKNWSDCLITLMTTLAQAHTKKKWMGFSDLQQVTYFYDKSFTTRNLCDIHDVALFTHRLRRSTVIESHCWITGFAFIVYSDGASYVLLLFATQAFMDNAFLLYRQIEFSIRTINSRFKFDFVLVNMFTTLNASFSKTYASRSNRTENIACLIFI